MKSDACHWECWLFQATRASHRDARFSLLLECALADVTLICRPLSQTTVSDCLAENGRHLFDQLVAADFYTCLDLQGREGRENSKFRSFWASLNASERKSKGRTESKFQIKHLKIWSAKLQTARFRILHVFGSYHLMLSRVIHFGLDLVSLNLVEMDQHVLISPLIPLTSKCKSRRRSNQASAQIINQQSVFTQALSEQTISNGRCKCPSRACGSKTNFEKQAHLERQVRIRIWRSTVVPLSRSLTLRAQFEGSFGLRWTDSVCTAIASNA
jgi:hypothetical protein